MGHSSRLFTMPIGALEVATCNAMTAKNTHAPASPTTRTDRSPSTRGTTATTTVTATHSHVLALPSPPLEGGLRDG